MSCHTTEHGACAQALRCIIERPLTRNELASIMCRGYGAAAAHVAQLLAIRAIEHAGTADHRRRPQAAPDCCATVITTSANPDHASALADLRHQFKAATGRPYLPRRGDTITHEVTR